MDLRKLLDKSTSFEQSTRDVHLPESVWPGAQMPLVGSDASVLRCHVCWQLWAGALPGEAGSRWGPVILRGRETQARAGVTHRDIRPAQQGAARGKRRGPRKPAAILRVAPGSVQPGRTVALGLGWTPKSHGER